MYINKNITKIKIEMNPVLRYLFRSILILSFLSFPISTDLFSQTYLISNYNGQTVNTCSGTFYDSGGSAGPYSNNENYTVTFCSGTSDHLKFDFTALNIGTGDVLYIYDGPNTGSPLIGTYPGIIVLTPFTLYTSGTCLTFNFVSDGSFTRPGWAATITCDPCPPPVTTPIIPSATEVCAGSTINYSVANHPGSTYNWTITNGTPASVTGGVNNLNVTWDLTGGVTGIVHVDEVTGCGSIGTSVFVCGCL